MVSGPTVTPDALRLQRESQLRSSRALALEVAGIGGWEVPAGSDFIEMDAAMLAIHGWTEQPARVPAQVPATHWLASVHPSDRARVTRAWADLSAGLMDRGSADFRIVRPGGEVRWLRTNFARLRDAQGSPAGVHGVCLDETDRQRLVRKLHEERAVMAVAERLALVGSFRRPVDGAAAYWSPQVYRIFARDPLAGPPALHQRQVHYAPSAWPRLVAAEARQMRDGQAFELELEIRLENGAPGWVRLWAEMERDDSGAPAAHVGCVQDISAVVHMRQQADAADARLRAVFDGSLLGILMVDDCARFIDANPAMTRLLGYTRQDLMTLTALDLGVDAEDTSPQAAWAAVLQQGHLAGRIRLRRKDGTVLPMDFSAVAHIQPGVHLCVLADVTAQVQAEDRLQTAQQQLRELAVRQQEDFDALRADLARDVHDQLGQTLSALKLELDLLRAQAPEAAGRMRALVQAGVDTARDVSRTLRPTALDLGAVAALRALAAETSMHGDIDVVLQLPEHLVPMPEPAVRALYRIAQEALSNAARHADAQTLALRLTQAEGTVRLEVQDDGCGFDPGAQTQSAGLGLLGMHERARQLGAQLGIHSQPGQGTRVVLTLRPATETAHEGANERANERTHGGALE
jgi:PAS domain S-box-containing protein